MPSLIDLTARRRDGLRVIPINFGQGKDRTMTAGKSRIRKSDNGFRPAVTARSALMFALPSYPFIANWADLYSHKVVRRMVASQISSHQAFLARGSGIKMPWRRLY